MQQYRDGMTRRRFLAAGTLGVAGLAVPDLFVGRAARAAGTPAARAVILLWMDGGPAPHETFDPKPEAPLEIRGAFGAIPTHVAGVRVSELMPRMARQMEKVAVLRAVSHGEVTHAGARQALLRLPCFHPALVIREAGSWIAVGSYARSGPEPDASLAREPATLRDAYGRTPFGENCLRARQQVEAGAPFVTVSQGGWDGHSDHFETCRTLVPAVDRAFAALLQDLHDRGLLATTLVLWMGEFGRSPWVNAQAGRDHWPAAGCAVVAGAGVRGGQVIGATDAIGASPIDGPVSPADLRRTIEQKLGQPATDAGATAALPGQVIRELL